MGSCLCPYNNAVGSMQQKDGPRETSSRSGLPRRWDTVAWRPVVDARLGVVDASFGQSPILGPVQMTSEVRSSRRPPGCLGYCRSGCHSDGGQPPKESESVRVYSRLPDDAHRRIFRRPRREHSHSRPRCVPPSSGDGSDPFAFAALLFPYSARNRIEGRGACYS